MNQPATFVIYAHTLEDPNDVICEHSHFTGYYISDICSSGLQAANTYNGATIEDKGTHNYAFIQGNPCGVPSGPYNNAHVYKISKTISKTSNQSVVLYPNYSNGFSGSNPNQQYMWISKTNESSTSFMLHTYVFHLEVPDMWLPCSPDEAEMVYKLVTNVPPIISEFTPNPPVINGNTGVFQVNLSQGTPPFNYEWWYENKPANVTVSCNTPSQGKVTITYASDYCEKSSKSGNVFSVYCRVWGINNSFDTKHFCPSKASTNGGCPWLYVIDNDSVYQEDNNILHKSKFPENLGIDITDKYVLNCSPGIHNSIITLSLMEKGLDTSFLNSIKLYAVDHPFGTKLCVTEDNQIAIFDSSSVLSVKQASLNGDDITENIQYHFPPKSIVGNDSLDYVYSEFNGSNFGNIGIITLLNSRYASSNKNLDGFLSADLGSESFTASFSRRENKSITAIPVFANDGIPSINSVSIDYYRDNEIRYIALAGLDYSNFIVTELPLIEALNTSQIDEILNVYSVDSLYSIISPYSWLVLKFSDIISGYDMIRDYVIEVNGRIGNYLSDSKPIKMSKPLIKKGNSNISYKNRLNQNYPNPFNPITKINYSVEKKGLVKIKIFDILGREIKSLVNEIKNPGNYLVEFNGSNLASGIYFYRMEINGFTDIKRMVLIK
ncbi:MAG: T9SS type A sorting domain-containing protein [Ignavibacteriae bacterium]|nr:T9SS type A sorting domain-containing protein [Ignavibacteriota bacterium]